MASLSISGWRRPAVHESTREREVLGGSDDHVEVAGPSTSNPPGASTRQTSATNASASSRHSRTFWHTRGRTGQPSPVWARRGQRRSGSGAGRRRERRVPTAVVRRHRRARRRVRAARRSRSACGRDRNRDRPHGWMVGRRAGARARGGARERTSRLKHGDRCSRQSAASPHLRSRGRALPAAYAVTPAIRMPQCGPCPVARGRWCDATAPACVGNQFVSRASAGGAQAAAALRLRVRRTRGVAGSTRARR